MGPDKVRSIVKISEDTTVRDVATSRYHLFWQTTKKNGISVVPFTARVVDGDTVTVETECRKGRGASRLYLQVAGPLTIQK